MKLDNHRFVKNDPKEKKKPVLNVIQVPKIFQEVLGQQTNALVIFLILIPSLLVTAVLLYSNWSYLSGLKPLNLVVMIILIFDITAGVIANISYSTNQHYAKSPKRQWVFIAIHIQPLIFAWLTGQFWIESMVVWLYTVIMAVLVCLLIDHPAQRPFAAAVLVLGIAGLILLTSMPTYLALALTLYMSKVIYSFPVDHYR